MTGRDAWGVLFRRLRARNEALLFGSPYRIRRPARGGAKGAQQRSGPGPSARWLQAGRAAVREEKRAVMERLTAWRKRSLPEEAGLNNGTVKRCVLLRSYPTGGRACRERALRPSFRKVCLSGVQVRDVGFVNALHIFLDPSTMYQRKMQKRRRVDPAIVLGRNDG